MNAAANARVRHEARKRAVAKQRKTLAANEKALAAAEKRTTVQLAQVGFVSHFEKQWSWFAFVSARLSNARGWRPTRRP